MLNSENLDRNTMRFLMFLCLWITSWAYDIEIEVNTTKTGSSIFNTNLDQTKKWIYTFKPLLQTEQSKDNNANFHYSNGANFIRDILTVDSFSGTVYLLKPLACDSFQYQANPMQLLIFATRYNPGENDFRYRVNFPLNIYTVGHNCHNCPKVETNNAHNSVFVSTKLDANFGSCIEKDTAVLSISSYIPESLLKCGLKFSLTAQALFYIDPSTGMLYTKNTFCFELPSHLIRGNFSFATPLKCDLTDRSAQSGGNIPFEILLYANSKPTDHLTKQLSLTLGETKLKRQKRETNNPPEFPQRLYIKSVPEEQNPNYNIDTPITATDPDSGQAGSIRYSLKATTDGRSQAMFTIDEVSGQLSTTQKLDRESIPMHSFTVYAEDGGSPSLTASASLTIYVDDVNDHAPSFESESYSREVYESISVGSTVITVRASDSDNGENAKIEYSIINPKGPNEVFRIDSRNGGGEVTTKANLDRESTERYTLQIQASDQAIATQRKTAITTVEITVLDENDNKPVFSQNSYTVDVSEDIDPSGHPVIREIKATDTDAGSNSEIRYSITGGNNDGTFSIDPFTGQLSVLKAIDYEEHSNGFNLNVRAQDNGSPPKATSTNVLVRVIDINDNTPWFYTSVFQETVEENVDVGYTIMQISAFDADSGENSQLSYEITGASVSKMPITIDSNSGIITTSGKLDRETDFHYSFHVIASDHGSPRRSSTATVDITVRDVNDNHPVFKQKVYNATISEEDNPGSPVVEVTATDKDENERVDYSITNGNTGNAFNIISQLGLITSAKKLNYKEQNKYALTITATDTAGQTDTATVFVDISDANTYRPVFQDTPYQVQIDENVEVDSTIFTVRATDEDVGANARISYTMADSKVFSIDPNSGSIIVKAALDRETTAGYTLSITATDHGRPPRSDTTDIEIIVLDVNDNFPKFSVQEYIGQVNEDVFSGTSVLRIEASDSDEGLNGRIEYTFTGGNNGNDDFRLEPNSGILRTNNKLDREKVAVYILIAFAVDRGSPQKSTAINITVKVLDINDNAPQFETNKIHLYIKENSAIGSSVGSVKATDPDSGENAIVEYMIVGGPDKDSFILKTEQGKPAIIETAIELDYEGAQKEYKLTLQAGSKHLFSNAEIVIHVLDVNDNVPLMKDFTIIVNNYEGFFPSGIIGNIPAKDPDFSDNLRYRITSGNQANSLHLDEDTGVLQLDSRLNSDVPYNGTMQVSVTDGINEVKASARLFVRLVTIDMLYHSITVRLNNIDTIAFLSPLYNMFVSALAGIVSTKTDNVFIVNIQDDTDVEEKVLNVSFSVRERVENNKDIFYSQDFLKERIYLERVMLADMSTLEILPFDDNLCVSEPCLNFDHCLIILKFGEAAPFVWSDTMLFRPIHPISKFTCVCPAGFAGMEQQKMCDTEVNLCYSNPCFNNATCIQKEGGYNCHCAEGFAGDHCEINIDTQRNEVCPQGICRDNSQCTPLIRGGFRCEICPPGSEKVDNREMCVDCEDMKDMTKFCGLRTRSFTQGTFLTYPSLRKRHRFNIKLRFATRESNALLFYNGRFNEKHDFIALEIIEGHVQFSFSLGSEVITAKATVTGGVNDGNWHEVVVNYLNRTVVLTVGEDCDSELSLKYGPQIGNYGCAATATQVLEDRCDNPTILCHRLLDLTGPFQIGGVPSLPTDFQIQNLGFTGCISDVMIDEKFLDLNDYVWNNGTQQGCPQKKSHCHSSPCQYGGLCTEGWTTYKCHCPPTKSGQNCNQVVASPFKLLTNSYLLYSSRKPNVQVPWYNALGFRTRSNTGILMQIEVGIVYIKLKIINGLIHYVHKETTAVLEGTKVNDGVWHYVEIKGSSKELQISLDYGQILKTFKFGGPLIGEAVNKVYIGGLEHQFTPGSEPHIGIDGCVQDIRVGNGPTAILSDPILSGAKTGCIVTNPCDSNPCPSHSVCTDKWRSHTCSCAPGRIGPNCDKICDKYNPCMGDTFCEMTDNGYFCKCKEGQSGQYCEVELQTTCPATWWGSPICGPCNCDVNKGFDPACKHTWGKCVCKPYHYKPEVSDVCFPCECYEQGTVNNNKSCHPVTGQCYCKAEVVGRKCDECNSKFAEVTNQGCEVQYDECPRSFAGKMWWDRTPYESIRWLPCPHVDEFEGTVGNASRSCSKSNGWSEPDTFNCTSPLFIELEKLNQQLDVNQVKMNTYLAKELAKNVHDATNNTKHLFGNDVFIAYKILNHVLDYENAQSGLNLTHTQDRHFIQYLVNSVGTITSLNLKNDWKTIQQKSLGGAVALLHNLEEYVNTLATNLHQVFTQPFDAVHSNIVLGLDTILKENMTSITIPKFNNKVQNSEIFDHHTKVLVPVDRILSPPKMSSNYRDEILINNKPVAAVGYVLLKNLGNLLPDNFDESISVPKGIPLTVNSPVFALTIVDKNQTLSGGLQAPITLQLKQSILENRTSPHCAYWKYKSTKQNRKDGIWSTDGCTLKIQEYFETEKYILCECDHMTSFAIIMAEYDKELPATDPITIEIITYFGFIVALICFCVVFILFCCMRGIESNANSIHVNLAFCLFVANLVYVAGIDKVEPQLGCKFVAIALHYFYLGTFAWMFVEVLHLYRMITEIRNVNHGSMKFYYLVGYIIPGIIVCLAVGLHTEGYGENGKFCWLETDSLLVWWSFSAPIILAIVMNVVVFAMALKAICTVKEKEDLEASSHKSSLRGVLLVMPLISFTWIFGLYAVNEDIAAYHYLFAFLTCFQGVFLLLGYIVFNKHTRKDLKYTLQKLQGKKDLDDSISGTRTSMLSRSHLTSALAYNHNDSSLDGGLNRLHHNVGISTTSTTSRSTTDNSKSGAYRGGDGFGHTGGSSSHSANIPTINEMPERAQRRGYGSKPTRGSTNKGLDSDSDSELSAMEHPDMDLASSHSSDDDDEVLYPPWQHKSKNQVPVKPPPQLSKPTGKPRPVATVLPSTSSSQATSNRSIQPTPNIHAIAHQPDPTLQNNTVYIPPYSKVPNTPPPATSPMGGYSQPRSPRTPTSQGQLPRTPINRLNGGSISSPSASPRGPPQWPTMEHQLHHPMSQQQKQARTYSPAGSHGSHASDAVSPDGINLKISNMRASNDHSLYDPPYKGSNHSDMSGGSTKLFQEPPPYNSMTAHSRSPSSPRDNVLILKNSGSVTDESEMHI